MGLKFRGLVESRTVIVWLQLATGSAFAVGSTSNATSMEPAFQLCSCGAPPLPTLRSGIGAVTASCVRNLATRVRRGTVHLARSIRTRLCGARTSGARTTAELQRSNRMSCKHNEASRCKRLMCPQEIDLVPCVYILQDLTDNHANWPVDARKVSAT